MDFSEITQSCVRLLMAAREWREAEGFTATWIEQSPQFEEIRNLGRSVDTMSGLSGLVAVIQLVRRSYRHGYLLDHFWDGIGEWRA